MSDKPPSSGHSLDLSISALGDRLVRPTDDLPSVRCIARPALVAMINEATRSLAGDGPQPSATRVLNRMLEIGLVHPVAFDSVAPRAVASKLYLIGYGVSPSDLHPFELLQAIVPDGVICYMSALEQHGLTTQPTAHHHIAKLETAPTRISAAVLGASTSLRRASAPTRHSLGRWQFTYQNVPYYLTTREPQRLRATQKRYLNAQSWYRLTTIEQTLLDTLHRPKHCGGPAVVFEAWATAASLLDPTALIRLVSDVNDDKVARQCGYMLQRVGFDAAPLLEMILKTQANAAAPEPPLLLRDMPYTTLDRTWGVLVP